MSFGENLQQIHQYFDSEAQVSEEQLELEHDASRCLQCGLCLEVCPNFACGSDFFGMAAAVPLGRKLELMDRGELAEASAIYRKHIYASCGKSLACSDVCPAQLRIAPKGETDAVIVYTSGSTGNPKGIIHSQQAAVLPCCA